MRKIALEEHFGHPDLFMRNSEGRLETRKDAIIGHLGPEYFEVVQSRLLEFDTTRLQAMDEAGVEKVLLSLTTFGIQAILDRAEAQNAARTVNDYLAERVRAHPNRYVGMASLAFHDADQAARELERCVTKLGFKGVMVNGFSQIDTPDNLLYLDDARMNPYWEALTALDVPLYIHPRPSHNAVQYDSHPELTGAAWGFAPETATHALRIGGNFNTQASLHCTMLTMGADRILFASDYPYEDYAEAGEFMDTVAISESDRRKIAYGNAKALLQALEGRPSALILYPLALNTGDSSEDPA